MKKTLATGILLVCITSMVFGRGGTQQPDPSGGGSSSSGGVKSVKYTEAPELNALVRAGKLPPVEQRLPANPVVVTPKERVGKYGGTMFSMSMGPRTTSDAQLMMPVGPIRFTNDLSQPINEVAESWEFSPDYRSYTLKLRPGIKWSSGNPLTADDVLFVFNDFIYDQAIQPGYAPSLAPGGKPITVTKIDTYTVRLDFAVPFPSFMLAHRMDMEPYIDSVWAKQYHLKYNPNAEALAKSKGFETWQACIHAKIMGPFGNFLQLPYIYGTPDLERPTLAPWRVVETDSTKQVYERNPYYWKVDTEGNQLPYINRVVVNYAADQNVVNLQAMTGELSIAGLDLLLINYPELKANERQGNYTVHLVYSEKTAEVAFAFNQIHPDPALNELFTKPQFRKAISMGINREEINNVVFLGQGTIMQATINPTASFFEQSWADEAAKFDPAQANRILDSLGLQRKNAEGVRLLPDGREFSFRLEYVNNEGPKKETFEMVSKHLRDNLGIKCESLARDRGYLSPLLDASKQDASGWHVDRILERSAWINGWDAKLGVGANSVLSYAAPWKVWINTKGAEGIKPSANALELYEAYVQWSNQPYGTSGYTTAGKRVFDLIQRDTFVIGIIGQSPVPLVIKNNLKNVFSAEDKNKKLLWGAANNFELGILVPEQLYLE
jgi:peptide/nickel transport system substrate-binding protein